MDGLADSKSPYGTWMAWNIPARLLFNSLRSEFWRQKACIFFKHFSVVCFNRYTCSNHPQDPVFVGFSGYTIDAGFSKQDLGSCDKCRRDIMESWSDRDGSQLYRRNFRESDKSQKWTGNGNNRWRPRRLQQAVDEVDDWYRAPSGGYHASRKVGRPDFANTVLHKWWSVEEIYIQKQLISERNRTPHCTEKLKRNDALRVRV